MEGRAQAADSERDKFVILVRKGKLKQPQQNGFSRIEWEATYNGISSPTTADGHLFQSGMWIDSQLAALRKLLIESHISEVPSTLRLRATTAILNRELVVVTRKARSKSVQATKDRDSVPMDALRKPSISDTTLHQLYTPDDIISASVDLATYPIDLALSAFQTTATRLEPAELFKRIDLAYKVANAYHMYSDIWMTCLWEDWYVDTSSREADLIRPTDETEARKLAASQ